MTETAQGAALAFRFLFTCSLRAVKQYFLPLPPCEGTGRNRAGDGSATIVTFNEALNLIWFLWELTHFGNFGWHTSGYEETGSGQEAVPGGVNGHEDRKILPFSPVLNYFHRSLCVVKHNWNLRYLTNFSGSRPPPPPAANSSYVIALLAIKWRFGASGWDAGPAETRMEFLNGHPRVAQV